MRQVRLGQTDLQVSRIAFGTWAFGGDWGASDLQDSKDSIHRALELGINLFDTAQGYGFGVAEQVLGEALRERTRREDVVIATKGGLHMEGGRRVRDASGRWLRAGVEASLRSLGTDYIDIYQVHWPATFTLRPRRPPRRSASWCARARSATPASPTTTSTRSPRSVATGGWIPSSLHITSSAGRSRTRSCPTPPSTTSAC